MMRAVTMVLAASLLCFLAVPNRSPVVDSLQGAPQTTDEPPKSCPVTRPPNPPFVPPAPYPSDGSVWIGSPKLWTNIPRSGTWPGLGHYNPDDPRYHQKLFWWSEGYDWRKENPPNLTMSGKRLDGPAPPLSADPLANAGWTGDPDHSFIVDGIFIPTLGCWKITGRFHGQELSYVVWVTN